MNSSARAEGTTTHRSVSDPDLLRQLVALIGTSSVLSDPADRWAYGVDNSRRQTMPGAVALPADEKAIVGIVDFCRRNRIATTVRGRGTGTTGAAVPSDDGLVISTERMNRILSIDEDNRVAVVQSGVTNEAVQDAAAEKGFFWPPDPTSAAYCSIGGNLACNAAGPRAVKYGTPRENTLGLRAVAGTGDVLRTGCYTTKGVVGYDLTRLLIGSEGTLAIITEATLKLTPMPAARTTMRAVYRDMASAAQAVSAIMAQPLVPRVLEFMDGNSIRIISDYAAGDLPVNAGAMLIIEADGDPSTLAAGIVALETAATNSGLIEYRSATDDEEVRSLWACRKALSPALRSVAPGKINEDVVVPVSEMARLIQSLDELAREFDITIVNFGHAGNGNIHVNLLGDTNDPDVAARMHNCLARVFQSVLDLGGTISGEHGIGYEKKEFVGLEIEPATLAMMKRIKQQFDPDSILNPGKFFPEPADAI